MCWHFDRPARLAALRDRAATQLDNLRREALDSPRGSGARAAFEPRIRALAARLDRLRLLARVARHNLRAA